MRFLPLLALMTSALTAQSLSTTFAGGNGQSGNMFDIVGVQSVTITGFDIHVGTGTWDVAVYRTASGTSYVGNEANASAWTLLGTATGVAGLGQGVPTPLPLTLSVPIGSGTTQGFYVTVTNGTSIIYTNGTAVGNVYAQDGFIQFLEGAGIGYPFAGTFQPRIWNGNIYYTSTGGGTFATNSTLGTGCGQAYASFYESFASAGVFDLANTTITWLNTGNGYTVLDAIPGTIVAPTGAAQGVAPGLLDGEQLFTLPQAMPIPGGSTTTLNVCTKGYIAAAAGNGIDFTPTAAELLAFPQTTWGLWHDYNQTITGSGLILYEVVGTTAYVTWNGVYSYLTTSPNTFQFQFDLVTGNVTLVIGALSTSADPVVVGYSPAGASLDPGSTDLSAALASTLSLSSNDVAPLSLTAQSRPVINTSWNMTVGNIPTNGVIGATILGLADPAIPDLGFLGLPGCGLRASLDLLGGFPVTGSTQPFNVLLPNNPSVVGIDLFASAAVFQAPPVNAFGAITANGIRGSIGDI